MSSKKKWIHLLVPGVLLGVVLLCRANQAWADWYALHFYPVWSGAVSRISAIVPFSLEEVVVIAAVAAAIFCLIRLRKRWVALVSLVLWIIAWAYVGWGLNYFRSSIFERAGKRPEVFEAQRFQQFLEDYTQQLNEGWQPFETLDKPTLEQEIKTFYAKLPDKWGLAQPKPWQRPKRLLVNWVYNAVGVSGYVGPFFSEIQINHDAPLRQYPLLYAHELSHLLGVSNEAEANYWGYRACMASARPEIRYAGLQSQLPYVLSNARAALSKEAYENWLQTLRPEVLEVYNTERAYWLDRYSPWIGRLHGWFYDLFLKSNRISSGTANYNEVIRLILTLEE